MPVEKEDVRQIFEAYRAETTKLWKDDFAAFKESVAQTVESERSHRQMWQDNQAQINDSERRARDVWQKNTDNAVDKQGRTFGAWVTVFQIMTGIIALLATVGIIKFVEWNNMANQLAGLNLRVDDSIKKQAGVTDRAKDLATQLD